MARARRQTADPTAVVGYVRVSTDEQADSGLGLAAQRAPSRRSAHGGDGPSSQSTRMPSRGKTLNRPGMAAALAAVESGAASAIVVAKLDRLSRSSLTSPRSWPERKPVGGTSSPSTSASTSPPPPGSSWPTSWRRPLSGSGGSSANAPATRWPSNGAGCPPRSPVRLAAEVVARIVAAHEAGGGWSAIAHELNAEGVPTAHGGARWYPSTVRAVVLAPGPAT